MTREGLLAARIHKLLGAHDCVFVSHSSRIYSRGNSEVVWNLYAANYSSNMKLLTSIDENFNSWDACRAFGLKLIKRLQQGESIWENAQA